MLNVFALSYGVDSRTADLRPFARSFAGLADLTKLLLAVDGHPSFDALLPHLRLLNDGRVLLNDPAPATDQVANKLFELYIGALSMLCGSDVSLDDPVSASGLNPDVLASFNGDAWGIACKVLHGSHPQTLIDLIESGLDQIDRSPATTGAVVVNVKNRINHDRYWPPATRNPDGSTSTQAYAALSEPLNGLVREVQAIGANLLSHTDRSALDALFVGRRSIPAFVLWAHTTAIVMADGRAAVNSVHVINIQESRPLSPLQRAPFECFDRFHSAPP